MRRYLAAILLSALSGLAVISCRSNPEAIYRAHVERGDNYLAEKKYDEAIIEYRGALQADPRSGEAHTKLGQAYLQSGDGANALSEYARAADLLPDDDDVAVKAADLLRLAGRFEDARTRAESVLSRHPQNAQAQLVVGLTLLGLKDLDGAIREVEEAVNLDPKVGRPYTTLGLLQLMKSKPQEAEAAFRKAVELDPKSVNARIALGYYLWAARRVGEAEDSFKHALEIDPKDLLSNRVLAVLYLTTNRIAQAEPCLLAAAEVDPAMRLTLADYYVSIGRSKDAVSALRPFVQDKQIGSQAKLRIATALFAEGNRAESHKLTDEVLQKEPNNSTALLWKARLLVADDLVDSAVAKVKEAVAADPTNAAVHYMLGTLYMRTNNTPAALAAFNQVLAINHQAAPAMIQLAKLYLAAGDHKNAISMASGALERQPDNPEPRLLLARGFLGAGDLANAEVELKGLEKKYPRTGAVQTQLGALYALRGDRPAARRAFEQALQLDPGDDDALADLLTIEVQSGRIAEARRLVDAYLEKTPNSSSRAVLAARMHFTAADPEGAERLLRKAIDLNSSNLSAYGLLGQLYMKQGRLEDARLQFEQAARRGTNPVAANTMVAIILQTQDKTDEALRRYEQIIALDPQAVVAANNLAYLYVERGEHLDEALRLAQVAKAQLPTEPKVNDTLGWIYFKKNLTSQAISLLVQAADADKANPVPRYHLGMAYMQSGDLQKAQQSLEKALNLSSDFRGADEARKALERIRG